jgi:2-polyprenyl-3-methyl-5-hydroxy-6-metoxy-1,4-benzoquinol methylase
VKSPQHDAVASNTTPIVPRCSCCGDVRFFRSIGANYPWRYLRCGGCGGVQLTPVPNEAQLQEFYNFQYAVEANGHLRQMMVIGSHMLDLLEPKTSGRELLEIGCSYGAFLRLAEQRGWSCVGVEASQTAAMEAGRSGLEVYAGTIENSFSYLGSRQFDVIAMWHVIEHLPHPRHVLSAISRLLRSGGYLTLRTPNAESVGARLFGRRWEWFYAPEHIFLYSARGIQQLLEQFDLKIEFISSQRGDAQTLFSQAITAVGSLAIGKLRQSFTRNDTERRRGPSRLKALHRNVSSIANVPGKPIDALLGLDGGNLHGSELVVLARKT